MSSGAGAGDDRRASGSAAAAGAADPGAGEVPAAPALRRSRRVHRGGGGGDAALSAGGGGWRGEAGSYGVDGNGIYIPLGWTPRRVARSRATPSSFVAGRDEFQLNLFDMLPMYQRVITFVDPNFPAGQRDGGEEWFNNTPFFSSLVEGLMQRELILEPTSEYMRLDYLLNRYEFADFKGTNVSYDRATIHVSPSQRKHAMYFIVAYRNASGGKFVALFRNSEAESNLVSSISKRRLSRRVPPGGWSETEIVDHMDHAHEQAQRMKREFEEVYSQTVRATYGEFVATAPRRRRRNRRQMDMDAVFWPEHERGEQALRNVRARQS